MVPTVSATPSDRAVVQALDLGSTPGRSLRRSSSVLCTVQVGAHRATLEGGSAQGYLPFGVSVDLPLQSHGWRSDG